MKKSQVINGVTVTDTFHEAFLHDPDSVESDRRQCPKRPQLPRRD